LVTAGAPGLPAPLVKQLKVGGVMVVPVGDGESQVLRRVVKRTDGSVEEVESLMCKFVPLVGAHGWREE
jgi:protein-L-isoaspartate(D-aspartate) O-methyltransferase